MTQSPLDAAHLAAEADPDQRLRFYDRLVGAELFLLLETERPRVFDLSDGPIVLAFDREDRLADFAPDGAERAEMTGRALIKMLAGQGVGLGLNLDAAPSSQVLDAGVIDWLADLLEQAPIADPTTGAAAPLSLSSPGAAPAELLRALDEKLSSAAGLAQAAYLAEAEWSNRPPGLFLALVGAPEAAQPALARAVGEALVFSGTETQGFDISFHAGDDSVIAVLDRVGLRFDLPQSGLVQSIPGADPDRPPKLR